MKFCPHCNSQVEDDALFCEKCGSPLSGGKKEVLSQKEVKEEGEKEEGWEEQFLEEASAESGLSQEEIRKRFVERGYPLWIKFSAGIMGLMIIFSLVSLPRYFKASVSYFKAKQFFERGKILKATEILEKEIKNVPNSREIRFLLGKIYLCIGEQEKSVKILEDIKMSEKEENEVKNIVEKYSDCIIENEKGLDEFRKKKYYSAAEHFCNALKFMPDNVIVLKNLYFTYAEIYDKTCQIEYGERVEKLREKIEEIVSVEDLKE